MTVSLIWRLQVEDFDSWLNPDPEEVAQMFKGMGALAYGLHRSPDDPNSLVSWFTFADADTARAFEAAYDNLKSDWEAQHPGAAHQIVDSWLGEDVEGYSRQF